MDPCLFFCHNQTSKNLDFRAREPHQSQPKRWNNGGFRLGRSRNRSLLPKRGATSYFENVLKSGGLRLKNASPARIAGRCERRWSHRFIPHFFRPPGSRRRKLHTPQGGFSCSCGAIHLLLRFAADGKAHSLRCASSPARDRCAGSWTGFATRPRRGGRGGKGGTGAFLPHKRATGGDRGVGGGRTGGPAPGGRRLPAAWRVIQLDCTRRSRPWKSMISWVSA